MNKKKIIIISVIAALAVIAGVIFAVLPGIKLNTLRKNPQNYMLYSLTNIDDNKAYSVETDIEIASDLIGPMLALSVPGYSQRESAMIDALGHIKIKAIANPIKIDAGSGKNVMRNELLIEYKGKPLLNFRVAFSQDKVYADLGENTKLNLIHPYGTDILKSQYLAMQRIRKEFNKLKKSRDFRHFGGQLFSETICESGVKDYKHLGKTTKVDKLNTTIKAENIMNAFDSFVNMAKKNDRFKQFYNKFALEYIDMNLQEEGLKGYEIILGPKVFYNLKEIRRPEEFIGNLIDVESGVPADEAAKKQRKEDADKARQSVKSGELYSKTLGLLEDAKEVLNQPLAQALLELVEFKIEAAVKDFKPIGLDMQMSIGHPMVSGNMIKLISALEVVKPLKEIAVTPNEYTFSEEAAKVDGAEEKFKKLFVEDLRSIYENNEGLKLLISDINESMGTFIDIEEIIDKITK